LVVDAVRMVIGKLFQIRGAAELNARPANTVLSQWVSYMLYTYDLHHNFGWSLTIWKFNTPANFSQFKHSIIIARNMT